MKKTKYILAVCLASSLIILATVLSIYFFAPSLLTDFGLNVGADTATMANAENITDTADGSTTGEVIPEPIPEPEPTEISLIAVGDNLIHMGVVETGKQTDGSYDYSFLFRNILDDIAGADISIINQETILGGNQLGFSGYPYFNSPTEVGDAIAAAGFNVVLQASNHSADQGQSGIINCATFWQDKHPEVLMVGIRAEKNTEPEIPIMEIEGVKFAILNYTYGPNMESFPSDWEGYMNILCDYDENTRLMDFTSINPDVLADIEEAETLADVVIVCPHWGTEYQTSSSTYQQNFALEMTAAGADLIIGTHPHVVEPIEWIESENGNKALCYYSLGNYVSTQKSPISMLEGMAHVVFTLEDDGSVTINEEETGVYPMVCQYTQGAVRVDNIYFLEDYTEELALKHGMYTYGGTAIHADELKTWSEEIFGNWVLSHDAE